MKYLIWGTGKIADQFLTVNINEYFFRNQIVAFVDNDVRKKGKIFFGKKTISPNEIKEYCYDAILICCNDIENIIRQIREQLKIQTQILTLDDISEVMYSFYRYEMKVYDAKIILVGNPNNRETNLDRTYIFRETEYLGIDQLEELKHMEYDYVLCTWPPEYWYLDSDRRYEVVERNLIQKIVEMGGRRGAVLTWSVQGIYFSVDKRCSFGEENPDKKFLLIKPGVGIVGLGGVVLQVVQNMLYAKRNHMIPVVDMESFKNSYITYDEIGKVNGWERFFLQPGQWKLEDIKKSKNIVVSMSKRPYTDLEKEKLASLLEVQPALERKIDKYCSVHFTGENRILGVLARGSDYVKIKPFDHCIQPDMDTMIKIVEEKFDTGQYDLIYLCTEEQMIVNQFREHFPGKVFCYPAIRVGEEVKGYLSESPLYKENSPWQIGSDYWVELCALSKCTSLVAGDCSGTKIALMLNENRYEDIYVFKLGRYGIDDIDR